MKLPSLFLLLFLLGCQLHAQVVVYTGSAKELRPGRPHAASRAYLVTELYPFRLAVIIGGRNARAPFTAYYGGNQINDPNGMKFRQIYASQTTDLDETRLDLLGNYTRDAEKTWPSRRFTGRLSQRKFQIIPIGLPGEPGFGQSPDVSEISLVFSIDARETERARKDNLSFEAVTEALNARLAR